MLETMKNIPFNLNFKCWNLSYTLSPFLFISIKIYNLTIVWNSSGNELIYLPF